MPLTFSGTLDRAALLRASDALARPRGLARGRRRLGPRVGAARLHRRWGGATPGQPARVRGGVPAHPAGAAARRDAVAGRRSTSAPTGSTRRSTPPRTPRSSTTSTPWPAGRQRALGRDPRPGSRRRCRTRSTAAGPTTYVPWQDCCLATDDFLVVRLMEVVVHADDLAASVGSADAGVRRRGAAPGARPARDAVRAAGTARTRRSGPWPARSGRAVRSARSATAPAAPRRGRAP